MTLALTEGAVALTGRKFHINISNVASVVFEVGSCRTEIIVSLHIMGNICAKLRSLFRRIRSRRPEDDTVDVEVADPVEEGINEGVEVLVGNDDVHDEEDALDHTSTYHPSSPDVSQMSEEEQVQVLYYLRDHIKYI